MNLPIPLGMATRYYAHVFRDGAVLLNEFPHIEGAVMIGRGDYEVLKKKLGPHIIGIDPITGIGRIRWMKSESNFDHAVKTLAIAAKDILSYDELFWLYTHLRQATGDYLDSMEKLSKAGLVSIEAEELSAHKMMQQLNDMKEALK